MQKKTDWTIYRNGACKAYCLCYAQQKTDHADEDEYVQFVKSLTMFLYKMYILYIIYIF